MSAPPLPPALVFADAVLLHRLARLVAGGGVPADEVPTWARTLTQLAEGTRAAVDYAGSECPMDYLDELLLWQLVGELEQRAALHGGPRLAGMLGELAGRLDRWCESPRRRAPGAPGAPEAR